jgi:hypothetical protein
MVKHSRSLGILNSASTSPGSVLRRIIMESLSPAIQISRIWRWLRESLMAPVRTKLSGFLAPQPEPWTLDWFESQVGTASFLGKSTFLGYTWNLLKVIFGFSRWHLGRWVRRDQGLTVPVRAVQPQPPLIGFTSAVFTMSPQWVAILESGELLVSKNNISVEFQGPVGKMSILVWTSGLGNLNGRCRFYSLFRKSKEPSSRCRERLHGFITNTLEGRLVKSHEGKWMCRGTKWRFSWTLKTLAKRLDRIMGVPQNWVSPKP